MSQLQKELQNLLGTNETFFKFFQENYIDGFWFWDINSKNKLLLDSKFAAKCGLVAGILAIDEIDDPALKSSISRPMEQIDEAIELENKKDLKLTIFDKIHQMEVNCCLLEEQKTKRHFVFAAIRYLKEYSTVLQNVSDLFELASWQFNLQTNELIINEKYAKILGYSLEELTPFDFSKYQKLSHPKDLIGTKKELAEYLSGEKQKYRNETRLKHKNGNWVWVEGKGKLITSTKDGKPEWMIGSHIDITERKLKEMEMDSLPLIALKTNVSVIIADKKGRITFVNKGFEKLTGYSLQEVVGEKPKDFLQGEETNPEDQKALSRKMRSGKAFTQEILNYTKKGEKYWTSIYVNPVYNEKGALEKFLSVQTDISEQKKYEEYLATFKSTLDQTEDCVFIFKRDSFKFIYANKGAERLTTYSEEELLQMHAYDIKPQFSAETFRELIEPLKNGEKKIQHFETKLLLKSGKEIDVEVSIQYIANQDREPHFTNIVRDITERKHLEKEMQRLSLVAEKTHNLVVISDKNGLIEYVNPAFEQKTGYSLSEVIGNKGDQFLYSHQTHLTPTQPHTVNFKKGEPFTQEVANYTRAGEKYWVSRTIDPVFNEQDELERFIAIETDITSRKKREQELQESEERLNFVLKGSELGYWDWYFQTGKVNVNERWFQMLGLEVGEIAPTMDDFYSLVHPKDLSKMKATLTNVVKKSTKNDFAIEVRLKHKKGHYVWVLNKGAVVEKDKKGEALRLSGIHSDISKRKKLEENLQEERQFLAGIMENNAAAILVLNSKGIIEYANPSAHKVVAFSKAELEGRAFFDPKFKMYKIDRSELDINEHPFTLLKKTNQPLYDQRIAFDAPDGKRRAISMSGAPMTTKGAITEYVFSILDITEQVEAQLQLENTKIQLESILSEMSDVVYSFSLPDYKLIYITPSIEKLSGRKEIQFREMTFAQEWEGIIYEKDKAVVDHIKGMLEKTGQFEATYRIVTTSNEIKYIHDKGKFIYENNKPIRLDGYLVDVTEKVKKENELKKYLLVVEGQNERLKNFTYIVSHNLRSHSANLQGLMYLIKTSHPEIYENEYIQKLELTSSKLDDTLHQLNEIVSVVSSVEQLKKVNVYSMVEKLKKAFSNLLSTSGVKLVNELDDNTVAEAVPAYLESIFTNLITNSIKYRDPSRQGYVKIWNESPDGILSIYVQDNGLGIDLERYGSKIFGMYKTFHSKKDARGIGLFLAKNQVESMGGKIEVESQVGVGTTFKLILRNGSI